MPGFMGRRRGTVAAVAISLLISGCAGTPEPIVGQGIVPAATPGAQEAFANPSTYVLRATDVVNLTVFREPDLSVADLAVGADGMVVLPLIGAVQAAGLTPLQLANRVQDLLREQNYVNDPRVGANVVRFASHRVTVEGAVGRPGIYTFAPGDRLSSAIAQAEGLERVARADQIAVFRSTADAMTVAKFDYRAMQQGTMLDPVLEPGDRVVVGTSSLSQAWQDLLTSLPVFALFSRI